MLILDPEHCQIVQSILMQYVPEYEVWAFGSRVNGNPKLHSDLDIVIRTSKPLSVKVMASLRHSFCESDLPMKVDVLDWSTIGKGMKEMILKNGHEVLKQHVS